MNNDLEQFANYWIIATEKEVDIKSDYYCPTRDIFQARFDKMLREFFAKADFEGDPYIVAAIAGEIGNNSFDHNIGNWKDVPGVFFGYVFVSGKLTVVIADRGRGILKTLKKVVPSLTNEQEALQVAFTERISGRAPEARGNGLKFVRENIKNKKMHLTFISGNALAELNDEMTISENDKNIEGCLAVITM